MWRILGGGPKQGDEAPDFALANQEGKEVRLSASRGKKSALLTFYPMDFTPG